MKITTFLLLLLSLVACTVEPEELRYGRDACHTCKMTLMDKKFGGELVTAKGKIFKFDDVNCMLAFYNAEENTQDYAYRLIVDFNRPAQLIEARDAFYLKSAKIKTPMASQVAAFGAKGDLEQIQRDWGGIYLVWGELVTQFK
jgi:copper chaperone NosL